MYSYPKTPLEVLEIGYPLISAKGEALLGE